MTQLITHTRFSLPVTADNAGSFHEFLPSGGLLLKPHWNQGWSGTVAQQDSNKNQLEIVPPPDRTLRELLVDRAIDFKVQLSEFSMHLRSEERQFIFDEIDFLFNFDGWDENDDLPKMESFRDFVSLCIFSRTQLLISLGFTYDGKLTAAWKSDSAIVEGKFSGNKLVEWSYRSSTDNTCNVAAGQEHLRTFWQLVNFYLTRDQI